MNKKLTHGILALVLAIATLVPMFPQSASADTISRQILIEQFNGQVVVFERIILRANLALGTQRLMFLMSAALGIPIDTLNIEFEGFGLSLEDFLTAEIIARSAGVPPTFVVDLVNLNRTFGQIVLQLNMPIRLVLFRFNNLIDIFNTEVGIQTGTVQPNPAKANAELITVINTFNTRFNLFFRNFSSTELVNLMLRRLVIETGLDLATLQSLVSSLSEKIQVSQVFVLILIGNSISASTKTALDLSSLQDMNNNLLIIQNVGIPAVIITGRILLFQRVVVNSMVNG